MAIAVVSLFISQNLIQNASIQKSFGVRTTSDRVRIADVTWQQTNETTTCKGKTYPKVTWSCNGNNEHSQTSNLNDSTCKAFPKDDDHQCPTGYTCQKSTDGTHTVECVTDVNYKPLPDPPSSGCFKDGKVMASQPNAQCKDSTSYQHNGTGFCPIRTECHPAGNGIVCSAYDKTCATNSGGSPSTGSPGNSPSSGGSGSSTCDKVAYSCDQTLSGGKLTNTIISTPNADACNTNCFKNDNPDNLCVAWTYSTGQVCKLYALSASGNPPTLITSTTGDISNIFYNRITAPAPQGAPVVQPPAADVPPPNEPAPPQQQQQQQQQQPSQATCTYNNSPVPGYNGASMECNLNYWGADFTSNASFQNGYSTNLSNCQSDCDNNSYCAAWTWTKDTHSCWLKGSKPGRTTDNNTVGGAKGNFTPPQANPSSNGINNPPPPVNNPPANSGGSSCSDNGTTSLMCGGVCWCIGAGDSGCDHGHGLGSGSCGTTGHWMCPADSGQPVCSY